MGTWIQEIDQEVIEICNKAKFPLIQARIDVSYIEIMTPIMNFLYEENSQAITVNDYSMVQNQFLNLVVNEENTDMVFKQMNKWAKEKISYYDTYGKHIYSDRGERRVQIEEEYLQNNFHHVLFLCSENGYTKVEINHEIHIIVLIRSMKNLFGLFIMNDNEQFEEDNRNGIISSMVVSGSLILQKRNRMSNLQDKAIEEYVTDLLVWNFPSDMKVRERGEELGLNVTDKNQIMVVNINSIQRMSESKSQQEIQNYVKRVVLLQMERIIKSYDVNNWLVLRSDTIIVFFNNHDQDMELDVLGQKFLGVFEGKYNLSVSIGISDLYQDMTKIPYAYQQAFKAAVLGRKYYGENKIVFYFQIYFMQKLSELYKIEQTKQVCNKFLLPLTDYDDEHGTELVLTLKRILQCDCNIQKTAELMYVHKNTVLQRKNKIIELLGYIPFEMPHILNFLIIFDIEKSE